MEHALISLYCRLHYKVVCFKSSRVTSDNFTLIYRVFTDVSDFFNG